MILKKFMGATS